MNKNIAFDAVEEAVTELGAVSELTQAQGNLGREQNGEKAYYG